MSKVKISKFAQSCILDRPVNNFGVGHVNDIMIVMMMMIIIIIIIIIMLQRGKG